MLDYVNCLVESMFRFIGQTVTVFTTSGGLSGNGFTGVLLSADPNCTRLLADIGAPPACPVGSACADMTGRAVENDAYAGGFANPMGAVCVIPTGAIVCFTHTAI
jgi:hypothetical protein